MFYCSEVWESVSESSASTAFKSAARAADGLDSTGAGTATGTTFAAEGVEAGGAIFGAIEAVVAFEAVP